MLKTLVVKAYSFAENAHKGQTRTFTGLPYFTHCKGVARLVENITKDEMLIAAALLHDVLEDTKTTYEELCLEFGTKVAILVKDLSNDPIQCKIMGKPAYLAEKLLKLNSNALLIKLFDRLHNVKHLKDDCVKKEFVKKYTAETEFILQELTANRLLDKPHSIVVAQIMEQVQLLKQSL